MDFARLEREMAKQSPEVNIGSSSASWPEIKIFYQNMLSFRWTTADVCDGYTDFVARNWFPMLLW